MFFCAITSKAREGHKLVSSTMIVSLMSINGLHAGLRDHKLFVESRQLQLRRVSGPMSDCIETIVECPRFRVLKHRSLWRASMNSLHHFLPRM